MSEAAEALIERARMWFIAGLTGAAIVAILAMFGPHAASLGGVQSGLEARVKTALAAQNLSQIEVSMRGQRAVLSGAAAVAGDAERAGEIALRAAGAGGKWAGGVTSVDVSGVSEGPPVRPYSWNAAREGEGVALRGYAPDRQTKTMLAATARAAFPGVEVTDEMRIASGAVARGWASVAADALQQLSRLERGEARLVDDRLILIGEGSAEAVPQIRNHYAAALPQGFEARIEINVEGQGIGIAELTDIDLSRADPQNCQAAFARLLRTNVIHFETNSAAISPTSARILDALISVAVRCDRNAIEIAGHTDSTGAPEANLALSRQRAEAVRAYLVARGVSPGRVSAAGYGAERPRADNSTRAGQAENRRIEFTVET